VFIHLLGRVFVEVAFDGVPEAEGGLFYGLVDGFGGPDGQKEL